MKLELLRGEGRKFSRVDLRGTNIVVWLTKSARLTIEPGDRLQSARRAILAHCEGLTKSQAGSLAAYYFALGERSYRSEHGLPWRKAELSDDLRRVYLARACRGRSRRPRRPSRR